MPDRQSKEYLEMKKRFAVMERNLLSATQNIALLTMEVERLRNYISSKDGFEDLSDQQVQHEQAEQQVQAAQQQKQTNTRRGPMTSSQGRTLKVINN